VRVTVATIGRTQFFIQSDTASGRYKIQTAQANHKDHALIYNIIFFLNNNSKFNVCDYSIIIQELFIK
jgi:hypothetical protein